MHKTDPRRITCTACQHENEIERVYCHNCGEKLDRSLLPALQETAAGDERQRERRKVKAMMNPNRLNWLRSLKTFVLVEIFAAFVAACYLAVQAPEGVPSAGKDRFPKLEVGDVWNGMMSTKPAVSVTMEEFDINYYLRKAVKGAEGPLGTKFTRAFAHLQPGLVTVATERNLWGLQLYNSATFKPVFTGGKWGADIAKFSIGRLTIPAAFGKLVKLDSVTLGALAQVFEKDIRNLARVEKIEPLEGKIFFVTQPLQ